MKRVDNKGAHHKLAKGQCLNFATA